MKINKMADYALNFVSCLAMNDGVCTTADIARAMPISRSMASQIAAPLIDAGIIDSSRGWRGCYRLAIDAANLTVADVLCARGGFDVRPGPSSGAFCDGVNGLMRDTTIAQLMHGSCGRTCAMTNIPTGEKAVYADTDEVIWHCELCHAEMSIYAFGEDGNVWAEKPNYCPECGAKVVI